MDKVCTSEMCVQREKKEIFVCDVYETQSGLLDCALDVISQLPIIGLL